MKTVWLGTFAAVLLTAGVAQASAELAQKNNCTACHQVEMKVVGPALKDVAAKYAGVDGAADQLAAKIKNGSSGVWGNIPMPPNVNVSDDDAKALAEWILSLK
ncbi:c-type cytochrome [Nitrosomonas mobilis]|uniref:Cytochrome c-552 n=1 Tax=Nitrosomonas mobilis TaxID=51642 RepID=A0A1G5SGJ8_9PROT|nr:c-type cytochrome [Nitrosomonas mobilis]SCZ85671.1 Cytochrome c-552 [Nitrosomonas mobilis]HNO74801.1 c-type cytochrome [Nitrosomonas mobilis]